MRLALATGAALTLFTELVRRAWQAVFMVAAIVKSLDLLKKLALRALGKVLVRGAAETKREFGRRRTPRPRIVTGGRNDCSESFCKFLSVASMQCWVRARL